MNLRLFIGISVFFLLLPPGKGACFDTDEVVLVTPEKVITLSVRLAKTPEQWRQGLRGIDVLRKNEGMFFFFPREGMHTFTTKGISFPIDILLINKFGRIAGILENMTGDLNHAAPFPIIAALEVNGGFCRENRISIGSAVRPTGFRLVPKDRPKPRQEEREKVEAKLRENVEKHPDDPEAHEALATFYTTSGQGQKAVEIFRKLLDTDKTVHRLNGMGMALAGMGQREAAEQYFLEAIELDPLSFRSYTHLIRISRGKEKMDRAAALLEEAVRTHPDFLEARLGLARLYLARGDIDRAETLFQAAGVNNETIPEIVRLTGDIRLRKGDYAGAADAYLRFLQARPYDPNAADLRVFVMIHKVKKRRKTDE